MTPSFTDSASLDGDRGDAFGATRVGDRVEPIPVLYLAPWVDYGGTAKGTLDWFKHLDRSRFRPYLINTQWPSLNRLLGEVEQYAEETWNLPDFLPGGEMPYFILDFIQSRGIRAVHVMNSKLGFELLPDLSCLPDPPVTVVQLHVEEDTRAGYVRLVTTRYGNLVDAFSVTSQHLIDDIVTNYDVDPARCHLIYTGIDAEHEFNPARVEPFEDLDDGRVEILFIGRIVAQKDPLLIVDVADRLREQTSDFRINVVGYGKLEADIRKRVAARGLQAHVVFRGPTSEPARWFASCDLLLLTSVYEGIPYVLFEAMAMGVPAVVPALPGTIELMPRGIGGRLISPRHDVDAYAAALAELIDDKGERQRIGREARAYVLPRFPLSHMARAHEDLYDTLLGTRGNSYQLGCVGVSNAQRMTALTDGARR